ncbi:hypothetical protein Slin14017_G086500 [Septoria linicola]|nr:hypothetical protein Slin14017_G086500 [Septoria linicola]
MSSLKGHFNITPGENGRLLVHHTRRIMPDKATDQLPIHLSLLRKAALTTPMEGRDLEFEFIEKQTGSAIDSRLRRHLTEMIIVDEMFTDIVWCQRGRWRGIDGQSKELYELQKTPAGLTASTKTYSLEERSIKEIAGLVGQLIATPWPSGRKDLDWLAKADRCREISKRLWETVRAGSTCRIKMPNSPAHKVLLQKHAEHKEKLRVLMMEDSSLEALLEECKDSMLEDKTHSEASRDFATIIEFDSDPAYLAALEEERQLCQAATSKQRADSERIASQLADDPVHCYGTSLEASRLVKRKQTKAKAARAMASVKQSSDVTLKELSLNDNKLEDQLIKSQQPIAVGQDTLRALNKIFHASNNAMRNELRWNVFLQAMADAGFAITEASGFAVSFANEEGSIVFHRPHPDPVLTPIMLHDIAKRMEKWFGWHMGRYTLRVKA